MNDLPNNPQIEPKGLAPFKKFCMTIGEIPSSYLESMSYAEMLLWFCNYLKCTVIPAINNNAEAVKELQDLYVQLKEYVNNYFTNLDVQEEINNKLDEMAESGELQNIINIFMSNTTLNFNTLQDLKNSNILKNGNYAHINGFYNVGDGGEATFKITENLTADNYFIHQLNNNLYAQLIITDNFNIHQIGAYGDNEHDDSIYLLKALENNTITKINLLNKEYKFQNTININKYVIINFNYATINFKESGYLFNISTHWNIKPLILNLKAIGNSANGFLNLNNNNSWGVSADFINFNIYQFLNVINAFACFNCRFTNGSFNTDGIYNFDGNSNNMCNANNFTNVYFKSYSNETSLFKEYTFTGNYIRNMIFESCSFEQAKTFFNLTNCASICLQNCGFEQMENIYNGGGIIIDNTSYYYGLSKLNKNDNYYNVPLNTLQNYVVYMPEDINLLNIRSNLRSNPVMSRSSYATDTENNVVNLWQIDSSKINLFLPFNILQNKVNNNTNNSIDLRYFFDEQNNESYLLTFTIIALGNDASYKVLEHRYICINKASYINLNQTVLRDGTWSNSDMSDVTFNDSFTNMKFESVASKSISKFIILCEFKVLGDQLT